MASQGICKKKPGTDHFPAEGALRDPCTGLRPAAAPDTACSFTTRAEQPFTKPCAMAFGAGSECHRLGWKLV